MKANISKSVVLSKQKNLVYNEVLKRFCRLFRTAELREKIETLNGEIQQLDMDLEEHQGKHLSLQLEFSSFITEKKTMIFQINENVKSRSLAGSRSSTKVNFFFSELHVDNAFSVHSSELTKKFFSFQVKEMSNTRN